MGLNALFLGYGRMGAALGEAWLGAGLVDGIDAVDPIRAQDVQARLYRQAADLPDTPYDLVVMAGVPLQTLRASLPLERPVVRSMPNTAVMVRQGCVGLYADEDVSPALRQTISRLFDAVGRSFWVDDEAQLHAVTAISGSGPAYYHLFSEALADAGVNLGLPRELAKQLAAQTALGAATLQTQYDADFVALRQAVTSPNGTTHAAIEEFEQGQALRRLVDVAAAKAGQRSVELSGG